MSLEFKKLTVYPLHDFNAGVVKDHINFKNEQGMNWTAYLQKNSTWLLIPQHQTYGLAHYNTFISLKTQDNFCHCTYNSYLNKFFVVKQGEHNHPSNHHSSTVSYFDWEGKEHTVQL